MEAFEAAGDPERYPGTGDPWQPLKLYYHLALPQARGSSRCTRRARPRASSPRSPSGSTQWEDKPEDERARSPRGCPAATTSRSATQALLAHATQVDPDGRWFAIPMEVQQRAWPTEDYQLARSLVDTELPEDDLFAGSTRRSPVAAVSPCCRGVTRPSSVYNDDTVSPGWLGLVVFLAMAVGTFFLLRSMFRHLRKVPKSFDGNRSSTTTVPARRAAARLSGGISHPSRRAAAA